MDVDLDLVVKTYDIDFAGIVSNIVYIRWLEDLRLALLEKYLPLDEQVRSGFGPILLETTIKYKKSIRMFDKPKGYMRLKETKKMRWIVYAEISVNSTVTTVAEQTGVFIDLEKGTPVRLPEQMVKLSRDFQ